MFISLELFSGDCRLDVKAAITFSQVYKLAHVHFKDKHEGRGVRLFTSNPKE